MEVRTKAFFYAGLPNYIRESVHLVQVRHRGPENQFIGSNIR